MPQPSEPGITPEPAELWTELSSVIVRDLRALGTEVEEVMHIVSKASTELRGVFEALHANAKHDGHGDQSASGEASFQELSVQAIRLLQFEDLARQLACHARDRASYLETAVSELSQLIPGGDSKTPRTPTLTRVKEILDKHRATFHPPHHLVEGDGEGGDVELF